MEAVERLAEELHGARRRRPQAGQGPDQRRLPGAVRAHQRDELALLHVEVQSAQDRPAADRDSQVPGADDGAQQPFAFSSAVRL
jgi:hypothetical protein